MTIISVTHHRLALAALFNDFDFQLCIVLISALSLSALWCFSLSPAFAWDAHPKSNEAQTTTNITEIFLFLWRLHFWPCREPMWTLDWDLAPLSWLLTFRVSRTKRHFAEHGVFTQLRWQSPPTPFVSCTLCYICFHTGTFQPQIKWSKCLPDYFVCLFMILQNLIICIYMYSTSELIKDWTTYVL